MQHIKQVPVSVVIPAYNSERYIREAIQSVRLQSLQVDEVIVVDNNCTDSTVEIAEELGARVIKEPKQNIAASRNAGIIASRNDWIALLDHDDLWEKDKIKYQWEAINLCPAARIIGCDVPFLHNGVKYSANERRAIRNKLQYRQAAGKNISYFSRFETETVFYFHFHTSSLIIHRQVFDGIGLYEERFVPQEDVEFMYRALAHYPFAVVDRKLSIYRIHDTNTIKDTDAVNEAIKRIAEQMLKYPERYSPGAGQLLVDYFKRMFVAKGKELSRSTNNKLTQTKPIKM